MKPYKLVPYDSLDAKGSWNIPAGPAGPTLDDRLIVEESEDDDDEDDDFNPFGQNFLNEEDASPPDDDHWDLFLAYRPMKDETQLPMPIRVSLQQYEQPMRIMVSQHYGDMFVPSKRFDLNSLTLQFLHFTHLDIHNTLGGGGGG